MRSIILLLAAAFSLALVPSAAADDEPCASGTVVDVGGLGLAYVILEREGGHCVVVESNGVAGFQCTGEDPDVCLRHE